jgi:hypothetical protein
LNTLHQIEVFVFLRCVGGEVLLLLLLDDDDDDDEPFLLEALIGSIFDRILRWSKSSAFCDAMK